jgi:hypothetical protein
MGSGTFPLGRWEYWANREKLNTASHCVLIIKAGWQLFTSIPDGAVYCQTNVSNCIHVIKQFYILIQILG